MKKNFIYFVAPFAPSVSVRNSTLPSFARSRLVYEVFCRVLSVGFIFLMLEFIFLNAAHAAESKDFGISARARVIPAQTTVGSELKLIVQAEFPKGLSLEPFTKDKINVSPFELRSIDKPIVTQKDDKILQTVILRLAIYELGDFEVPAIPVTIWNIQGKSITSKTSAWPIKIVSVGKKKEDTGDIRPIKGPMGFDLSYWRNVVLGLAVVALSGLLIFLVIRRRRKQSQDLESKLPPEKRAELELHRLEEKRYITDNLPKEHYTEISNILRRYLERRYQVDVMELTTPETVASIREKIYSPELVAEIREILQTSDLVKFALYVPDRVIAGDVEKRLKQLIVKTTPAPELTEKKKGEK